MTSRQLMVLTYSNRLNYPMPFWTAWAHLILYGEEATRKAQKEGEDAAAAYEQEKQDIADGKILPPQPQAEKKPKVTKKGKAKKGNKNATETKKEVTAGAPKSNTGASKKRKQSADCDEPKKKAKPGRKPVLSTADKEALAPILAKGASRVSDQKLLLLYGAYTVSKRVYVAKSGVVSGSSGAI
jgi:hypothetical protein